MSNSMQSTAVAAPARLDTIHAWVASLRLRTLPLAGCGILLGGSLAAVHGGASNAWQPGVLLAALVTALLLQILANLANDYGDFSKSADTPERIGPKRGMHLGLIRPDQMKRAILVTVALCIVSGLVLMTLSCHSLADVLVFAGLGLLSIAAAITYTVGRHAYGYCGLGDLSVLAFFGWVSVLGSYYLMSGQFDWQVCPPAMACGLLSVLVLNVNNLRDLEQDRLHGKITLAVRLGPQGARVYHALLLLASLLALSCSAWHWMSERPWVWLWLAALPLFLKQFGALLWQRDAVEFRAQLGVAVKISIFALGGFIAGLWVRL